MVVVAREFIVVVVRRQTVHLGEFVLSLPRFHSISTLSALVVGKAKHSSTMTTQHPVWKVDHVWLPSSQTGVRLAATLWLPFTEHKRSTTATPEDIHSELKTLKPCPALLEYIPYRRNDGTAYRDSIRHPIFAAMGFACLRVDIVGSGDSDGIIMDEYTPLELQDGACIIEWAAQQPWCNGKVGMFGKSWGAFNSLQIAALRPQGLAAIIAIAGTHDRYAEDVHYLGGVPQQENMLPWASVMLAYNAAPPDPKHCPDWLAKWSSRVKVTPHPAVEWLKHQRRDEYWKHGSVCEDYDAIDIPCLLTGGWADGYTSMPFRMVEAEKVAKGELRKRYAIIGPWAHQYPDEGHPGPRIPFMLESLQWWRAWLMDDKDSPYHHVDAVPAIRGFELQTTAETQAASAKLNYVNPRPGFWLSLNNKLPNKGASVVLRPNATVGETKEPSRVWVLDEALGQVCSSLKCGINMGGWWGFGGNGEAPNEQSSDDAESFCVDTVPFETDFGLFGFPTLTVAVRSSEAISTLVVRLCHVTLDPTDGKENSQLVTWGNLNLAEVEKDPDSGIMQVVVQLRPIMYRFQAGTKLRIALSSTLWPMLWPSPVPATLTFYGGELILPFTDNATMYTWASDDLAIKSTFPVTPKCLSSSEGKRTVSVTTEDAGPTKVVVEIREGDGRYVFDDTTGVTRQGHMTTTHTCRDVNDPLTVSTHCVHNMQFVFPKAGDHHPIDTTCDIKTETTLECANEKYVLSSHVHISYTVTGSDHAVTVHQASESFETPRVVS